MGTAQSSHASYNKSHASNNVKHVRGTSVRGRKRSTFSKTHEESAPFGLVGSCVSHHSDDVHHPDFDISERFSEHLDHEFIYESHLEMDSNDAVHTDDNSSLADIEESFDEDSSDTEEEEDDEEFDEFMEERMRVLADARKLKESAGHFMHPENPVERTFGSRCYFDRASAPPRLTKEEADELGAILDDAKALKKFATDYVHPEICTEISDPTVFGRNYYNRFSATKKDDSDEADECAKILNDARMLKKLAADYLHPETPVTTSDPTAYGRNFFSRPSAPEYMDDEREGIMADMKALKQSAVDYMHPEVPVTNMDPSSYGRNYFLRASAPSVENPDDPKEYSSVLNDLKALKKLAVDFLHPENPISTNDPTLFGRNYFTRASAAPQESDYVEERSGIMEDMKMLKKYAVDYMHPEVPVVTSDPCASGRNFFSRLSAPEYENEDVTEEREMILSDMKAMKKLAVDYMHPEVPVTCTDPTAFGRNYFSRFHSVDQESLTDAKYRSQVMCDLKVFKEIAANYLHPEIPITVSDPTARGRNFFGRPSAPEQESLTDAKTRSQIMEDLQAMKKFAMDYLHPEVPVGISDPTAFARNFFSRPSAPDSEDAAEKELILQDIKALKQLSVIYRHPEAPVTADPTAFGRNYFTRPSAADQPSEGDAEEYDQIMCDVKQLKKLAVDYLHPELPVSGGDPTSFGRNYFSRPSAQEWDVEYDEEREAILKDMAAMKKLAIDYLHPEIPVVTSDSTCFARNYFTRFSASEQASIEYDGNRTQIMADMTAMKKLAVDFLHPELPVATDPTSCARNYFTRPSAPETDDLDSAAERNLVIEDMKEMKKLATIFRHPELSVQTENPMACGRNYFDRASAAGHYYMIHTFPAHDDDHEASHHHEHLDHFGMDEHFGMDDVAMYGNMHHEFVPYNPQVTVKNEDEEGNLSRSPSSVMLFSEETQY